MAKRNVRDHPLSTYAKSSKKLALLTPCYAHICVRNRGLERLVFRKILRTYLLDGPLQEILNLRRLIGSLYQISRRLKNFRFLD